MKSRFRKDQIRVPPVISVIANIIAERPASITARFARSFERLVHWSVTDAAARARQARLLSVLMVAPFVFALVFATGFAQGLALESAAALTCAVLCGFWSSAIFQALGGRAVFGLVPGLLLFSATLGIAMALSGGLASPLALLLVVPFFETRWIGRKRGDLGLAGLSALGAALTALAVQTMSGFQGQPSILQWLAPVAYSLSLAMRFTPKAEAPQEMRIETVSETAGDDTANTRLTLNAQGEVLAVSVAAANDIGLDLQVFSGKGLFERLHVGDRVVFLKSLSDVRLYGAVRALELRVLLPDNAHMGGVFRTLAVTMQRGDDEQVFLTLTAEALSIAHAEPQTRDSDDERDLAQNRFLATVSHELRTPLNAIIGMSDMLAHEICGPLSNERQREYVSLIRQSGDHLLSVVNTVLEVSKVEFGAYRLSTEPFAFEDVAEFCARMLESEAATKNVHITLDLAADLPKLDADRRAVQQVLINLACNAVKFTRENGHVTIAAQRSGRHMVIRVIDDGIGIPADKIDQLGKPFTQVDNGYTRASDGSGLGLALVKGLVGLHKGTLTIDSMIGRGTTVTVTLPIDAARDQHPADAVTSETTIKQTHEEAHGSLRKAS